MTDGRPPLRGVRMPNGFELQPGDVHGCAARGGDAASWECLVRRFDAIVRRTARSFRLQAVDVDDVVQATWLDLLENVDRIREPACTAAWLVTATRRRALRTLQLRTHALLCDDPQARKPSEVDGPQARLIDAERRAALSDAIARLPPRQRTIMTLLLTDGALDYKGISALADVCCIVRGPMIAAVTAGWRMTNASAMSISEIKRPTEVDDSAPSLATASCRGRASPRARSRPRPRA